jgi:vesicle coat complex subunit
MIKPKFHRSKSTGNRKKNAIPLSKLRASEAMRTVVDHPRRLEELLHLLMDKERSIRGRAASTVAGLSESHPARLVRHLEILRESLADDSAYVRWHMVYALGQVIRCFPGRASFSLSDLKSRLADEDRLVRMFACRSLEAVAARKPCLIKELFAANSEEVPPPIARWLPTAKKQPSGKSLKG